MNIIVINLGLHSIRAIVFNEKGEKLVQSWYPVKTVLEDDRVEQSPNEWWQLCKEVIKEAVSDAEIRDNTGAITVTSSSCCLVALDVQGKVLMDSIMVSDKRAAPQAEKISNNPHFINILAKPNNLAVASFMIPKILWIKENIPEVFEMTDKFLAPNDFLIYKLTGLFYTDTLNAEKFYYDIDKSQYPKEIFGLLRIKENQLPEVVMPGTKIGHLNEENKKYFGFKQDIDVIVSTYDAICAFWGSGVSQPGEACNVCGTVSSLRVYSEHNVNPSFGILSQCFGKEKMFIVGGSNNIDGGLLEWAKNAFYGDSYPEKYVYNIMENEASQAELGAESLFFIPYIMGERVPFFDNEVRGVFFGLERYHTRNHIMRSIFESSGFMIYDILRHIEKTGLKIKDVRVSGGLSQNSLVCKIRADIIGKKVLVVDEPETTAFGAFMIAAITENIFDGFRSASQILQYKKVYTPNMDCHRKYNQLFGFYKKIYQQTKLLFKERSELIKNIQEAHKGHILHNL